MADVTMPQLGETVTEGTITQWFKNVGDAVAMDEILFEVSTDKVDSEVPSPVAGVVTEILAAEGDVVEVGQVLCRVGDADAAPAAVPEAAPAPEPVPVPEPEAAPSPEPAPAPAATPEPEPAPAPDPVDAPTPATTDGLILSPVVRRLIADNGLDAGQITGTGLGGRITRNDVEQVIQARAAGSTPEPAAPAPAAPTAPAAATTAAPAPVAEAPRPAVGARDQVVPLNNIRKRTA
ncbi:MAG TPA: dihydrolipoyllysine-residue succinyltransferase, partial [Acidimicrobiaceae bacterium]|nr:dihydrolipoyllysine-residue succinyltransferase [Acidimicrobiaceae bacterium]